MRYRCHDVVLWDDSQASAKLLGALIALRHAGIDKHLLIDLNDSGFTFDEIADYLERMK